MPAFVPANHEYLRRQKVIVVGVTLGWITGLNKSADVEEAVDHVKW